MEEQNNAQSGSLPEQTQKLDSSTNTDEGAQNAGSQPGDKDQVPFDQDPRWKSARLAEKKLNEMLSANGLEDVADLVDLIESGKAIKGKQIDIDTIDELMQKAATLDQYNAYWKSEEERRKRETEDPAETLTRLDRENAELKKQIASRNQAVEGERALKNYASTVNELIMAVVPDVPKEDLPFIAEYFGVGHPFADIDITDKAAIRKMVVAGSKKLENYVQQRIKRYVDGKDSTPTIPTSGEAPVSKPQGIRSLKDARRALAELASKSANFGI